MTDENINDLDSAIDSAGTACPPNPAQTAQLLVTNNFSSCELDKEDETTSHDLPSLSDSNVFLKNLSSEVADDNSVIEVNSVHCPTSGDDSTPDTCATAEDCSVNSPTNLPRKRRHSDLDAESLKECLPEPKKLSVENFSDLTSVSPSTDSPPLTSAVSTPVVTPPISSPPVNIFATSLFSKSETKANQSESFDQSNGSSATYKALTSSAQTNSDSTRTKHANKSTPNGAASCWLPFCSAKCEVAHHPMLQSLSRCLRSLEEFREEEEREAVMQTFGSAVETHEKEIGGWTRTDTVVDVMKEYYYPLLHSAAVSGNVGLVRWMMHNGFGAFTRPVCLPLMQCMLNLDCTVRKGNDRIRIFKEMMELLSSDVAEPTFDSAERPTSLLIAACSRTAADAGDRPFFVAAVRNIVSHLTDKFDSDAQRKILQVRNTEGNTCVHEFARFDDSIPTLKRLLDLCVRLGIADAVFKSPNIHGKTPVDVAADAGALRLVTFLSPLMPSAASKATMPFSGEKRETVTSKTTTGAVISATTNEPLLSEQDVAPTSAEDNEEKKSCDNTILLPVIEEGDTPSPSASTQETEAEIMFRPLFAGQMKAEAKLKILEKHLAEKRKLLVDVKSRVEKHEKSGEEIKAKIEETTSDTNSKIENMKVLFEVLLRTQRDISANDDKVKTLNRQLAAEMKTVVMHEKVSQELTDVLEIMEQLRGTLMNQTFLNM